MKKLIVVLFSASLILLLSVPAAASPAGIDGSAINSSDFLQIHMDSAVVGSQGGANVNSMSIPNNQGNSGFVSISSVIPEPATLLLLGLGSLTLLRRRKN